MTKRQVYKDMTLDEALNTKADIFQIKYDGIWARIVIKDGLAEIYSRTNTKKATLEVPPGISGELVGEYMFGSQRSQNPELKGKIMVFDCTELDGEDVKSCIYKTRYPMAEWYVNMLGEPFHIIPYHPVRKAKDMWKEKEKTEEGFVFRMSTDLYSDSLIRCKYSVTKQGYAVAFYKGEGKHYNRLGAIGFSNEPDGDIVMRIGGGFTDIERDEIWDNVSQYYNRPMLVTGKGEFESGALRHPNFLKWL